MKLNVLYQFNNNYAIYAGVSIASLFQNNQRAEDIIVHVFDDESDPISQENRIKFQELAQQFGREIKIYDTHNLIGLIQKLNIPTYRNCYAANMRLFLDKILSNQIDRVLYLDADTLVVGCLDELFSMGLDGNIIGMVLECQGNPIKQQIGMSENTPYFNSGMILYDLKAWRNNNCSEVIINHAQNVRAAYVSPDQDILNIALCGKIMILDLKYNYQPFHTKYDDKAYLKVYSIKPYYDINELKKAREDVRILHCYRFLGRFPWNQKSHHPNEKIWDEYLKSSPWKNFIKIKCRVSIPINIEIVLQRVFSQCIFLKIFSIAQNLRIKHLNKDLLNNQEGICK